LRKQKAYLLRLILFSVLLALTEFVSAQDSGKIPLKDTLTSNSPASVRKDSIPRRKPVVHKDSSFIVKKDSLQLPDTAIAKADSLMASLMKDSVSKMPFFHSTWEIDPRLPLSSQLVQRHPFFGFNSKPLVVRSELKQFKGKEVLFYALIALLIAFSLSRQAFPKYFNDLFRLLFRNTLKQKQIREQLIQMPLPSLLMNIFFVITGGLYIDLLLQHYDRAPIDNFWLLSLYCSVGLAIIYAVKFFGLKVAGWLFNIKPIADAYIFVVFIINKVIGVFLLPFLVLLSFTQGDVYTVVLVLSWCGLGILLIYRFLLTFASIRNQVRFNPFHFFLYLCAFEVAPLLLIYKALLFFFR